MALLAALLTATPTIACGLEPASTGSMLLEIEWFGTPWVQLGEQGWVLVDTGAPRTVVMPHVMGLDPGPGRVVPVDESIEAPLPWLQTVIVADDPVGTATVRPQPYAGVLGMDALSHGVVVIDPVASVLAVGHGHDFGRAQYAQRVEVPMELSGAGVYCVEPQLCVDYEPSRMVIPVEVRGMATWAVLDTGASETVVTSSLSARLPRSPHHPPLTSRGEDDAPAPTLQRADVAVASAAAQDVIVRSGVDEALFAKLQVETGRRIEVLLGWSYLRHFVVEFDVERGSCGLYPHADAPPPRGWKGTGMLVRDDGECFAVARIYDGQPADRAGIEPGDCIISYDGQTPSERTATSVNLDPTTPVQLVVDDPRGPRTITLEIVDMLPPATP